MVLIFGISASQSRGDGAVTFIDQAEKRLKIPVWILLPGCAVLKTNEKAHQRILLEIKHIRSVSPSVVSLSVSLRKQPDEGYVLLDGLAELEFRLSFSTASSTCHIRVYIFSLDNSKSAMYTCFRMPYPSWESSVRNTSGASTMNREETQ